MATDLKECSDKELEDLIEDLRGRVSSHDHNSDILEVMLKNAVLMNAYIVEKQKRNTDRAGRQSMKIAFIALAISFASLCFSYFQSQQETTVNTEQVNAILDALK